MHDHEFDSGPFPRGVLIAAAALISLTLLSVVVVRIAGIGHGQHPETSAVSSYELHFADMANGGVSVADARSGRVVQVLAPGTNGFLRGVLRGLARDRKRQDIGAEPPFRLTRWSDGRLSLEDPATHRRIALEAFGRTNEQVFANLLLAADQSR